MARKQEATIVEAILDLGGINPEKIRKAGTNGEWSELPKPIGKRIYRHASTQGPDEIASQLEEFGIYSENELLDYLKNPHKMSLGSNLATAYDQLEAAYEDLRRERDQLRDMLDRIQGVELNK